MHITDYLVFVLFYSRCTNLNHLSLAHCLHFTSKGLRSIPHGKGCRRLVYLDLSGCSKLTAEGLKYVGTGCPILNTVILDDIPSLSDAMIMVWHMYSTITSGWDRTLYNRSALVISLMCPLSPPSPPSLPPEPGQQLP